MSQAKKDFILDCNVRDPKFRPVLKNYDPL